MVTAGQSIPKTEVGCLHCGKLMYNRFPPASAFVLYACSNDECDMVGIGVTIEKVTNTVFHVDCLYWFEGKPAFPSVLVNGEGKTVWAASPKEAV